MKAKKFFTKQRAALALATIMMVSIIAGVFAASSNPTFSDVPPNHWAYSYVERAADNGWVNGVGSGQFGPEKQISYAEMFTMLMRVYLPEEADGYYEIPSLIWHWYDPYALVAFDYSFTDGLQFDYDVLRNEADKRVVTRYDLAQFLYNMADYFASAGESYRNNQGTAEEWGNFYFPKYDAASVRAGIADWSSVPANYREAVTAIVDAGIITGVDGNGTFNGNGVMTRAQAATVMCRFIDVLTENGAPPVSSSSTEPTTPAEPTTPTTGLGQKLPSGATAAAGVLDSIGKDDAYPTYGNSDVVSNNGYFTGAPNVDIGNAQLVYEFLDWVNEARVAEGHEPLTWVTSDAAEEHTLQRCYELVSDFSHERPEGKFAAEVCAEGYIAPSFAFEGWMNSPGHKQTLMSDSHQCMSAARAGNYWIICVWRDDFRNVERCAYTNYDVYAANADANANG